jgi:hypothetical protein
MNYHKILTMLEMYANLTINIMSFHETKLYDFVKERF